MKTYMKTTIVAISAAGAALLTVLLVNWRLVASESGAVSLELLASALVWLFVLPAAAGLVAAVVSFHLVDRI